MAQGGRERGVLGFPPPNGEPRTHVQTQSERNTRCFKRKLWTLMHKHRTKPNSDEIQHSTAQKQNRRAKKPGKLHDNTRLIQISLAKHVVGRHVEMNATAALAYLQTNAAHQHVWTNLFESTSYHDAKHHN